MKQKTLFIVAVVCLLLGFIIAALLYNVEKEEQAGQLAAAASTGRRIDQGEIRLLHNSFTDVARSSRRPICSARTTRLIFSDAVRGKSWSQIR